MIRASIYQNSEGMYTGFTVKDHADYADSGEDIVCAAVSALVINAVNSMKALTGAEICADSDPDAGRISLRLKDTADENAQLLLKSLVLGLESVETEYDKYLDLIIEEV